MKRTMVKLMVAGMAAIGVGVAVQAAAPPRADATNLNTKAASGCINGRWTVTLSVHNDHTAPLHVGLTTTHGPSPEVVIAPGKDDVVVENPDDFTARFDWRWTSSDGHLKGDAISGTFTRPEGCGHLPTTTTVPPTTTTAPPADTTPTVPEPPTVPVSISSGEPTPVAVEQPPAAPPVKVGPPKSPALALPPTE